MINKQNKLILVCIMGAAIIAFLLLVWGSSNTVEQAMSKASMGNVEVLHIEALGNKDALIIYKVKHKETLGIGVANKSYLGWKWKTDFGDIPTTNSLDMELSFEYWVSPDKEYSIIYGAISTQQINKVTVAYLGTAELIANTLDINEDMKVWFTPWGVDNREIVLRAKDINNETLIRAEKRDFKDKN